MTRKHDNQCEGWKTAGDQLVAALKTWKFWKWRLGHHLKDVGVEWWREVTNQCPEVVNGRRLLDDEHADVKK